MTSTEGTETYRIYLSIHNCPHTWAHACRHTWTHRAHLSMHTCPVCLPCTAGLGNNVAEEQLSVGICKRNEGKDN